MDRYAALAILRANEAELRRRGVRHAALFGSVARGEARADSDLDVMIEIDAPLVGGVYGYVGLCRFIGDLFPIRVDVANRAGLKDRIRERAERDALVAF
ncbi:putative nucleotidyltransferase [Methylobacterium brachiatum]|uniref:Nucleotidyltransferase n=1 Tax=Methylobacterium brachiatum TaxID=269660 RepID=A0AAJ1WXU4_9HYPH|nr:nucleotidyltransferase domain-containing protein [Methylobacterium brachiatum]MCB4806032.1 nucleotidyltransferase domain-containing protein [Methylobacterium brachiatum]MDQ0543613.1 putative nucleotidyltransferase [Methylobacterium brachiatum]